MRRFQLHRDHDITGVSGPGVVADGVLFPDGTGPFVEITRVGRWTYEVSEVIADPSIWLRMTGDLVWGRRRAQRRALKRLAQYRRDQQRRSDVKRVTG